MTFSSCSFPFTQLGSVTWVCPARPAASPPFPEPILGLFGPGGCCFTAELDDREVACSTSLQTLCHDIEKLALPRLVSLQRGNSLLPSAAHSPERKMFVQLLKEEKNEILSQWHLGSKLQVRMPAHLLEHSWNVCSGACLCLTPCPATPRLTSSSFSAWFLTGDPTQEPPPQLTWHTCAAGSLVGRWPSFLEPSFPKLGSSCPTLWHPERWHGCASPLRAPEPGSGSPWAGRDTWFRAGRDTLVQGWLRSQSRIPAVPWLHTHCQRGSLALRAGTGIPARGKCSSSSRTPT